MSIIAPKGVYGGITAFPTSPNATGITVYDARVVLRGLSINGQGGDFGIWVFGDAVVHIEDCTISNLDQYGVRISGLIGSAEVFIEGSVIRDNGSHGVHANGRPVDGASTTMLVVSDWTIAGNEVAGILGSAYGAGASAGSRVARNTIMGNAQGVHTLSCGGEVIAIVSDNLLADNHSFGAIFATGAGVKLTASNNSISGNFRGFFQESCAMFKTRFNNTVQDNFADVLGTVTSVGGD